MPPPIYLDYNATTPVDARVLEAMLPYFAQHFGNASSRGHAYGWAADEAVEQAREQVAALLGAAPEEVVFTSGATEALSLALKGAARAYAARGRHLVTVQTEHRAVLDACRALERDGFTVTYLGVDADGQVQLDALEAALTPQTTLVAVMAANNETGVLQPLDAVAHMVRSRGMLLLTDATQALGKIPVSVEGVDLLAASAHKCYGPKGVGLLYVRRREAHVRLVPLQEGGGQEQGLRGGTLNTPGIVGLGAAAALAQAEQPAEAARLRALRDRFEAAVREALPEVRVGSAAAPRLPQTSSLTLPGLPAARLLPALRELALSTGSACASGSGRPSHVLKAMGYSDADAQATLRVSLGRFTTTEEVEAAAALLVAAAEALSPAA